MFFIAFLLIFRCIWAHCKVHFSILNSQIFDFSKSVRNRPENAPKPSPKHPQTIPNPSQKFWIFRIFGLKFQFFVNDFLMDFWWIVSSGVPLRAGSSKIPRSFVFLGLFLRVLGFGWYVGPYHWGVGPILGIPFRAFFSPSKIGTVHFSLIFVVQENFIRDGISGTTR